jgi:hypothetical protein
MTLQYMDLRKRGRGQRPFPLDDPQFRAELISWASTGAPRVVVAAHAGIPKSTLYDWLERGRAEPDVEPWGTFTVQYLRAEKGVALAGPECISRWVAEMLRLCRESPLLVSRDSILTIVKILESSDPEHWGASKHRKLQPEPDGAAYLERKGLTTEQLRALLRDPPEEIANAIVAESKAILELISRRSKAT